MKLYDSVFYYICTVVWLSSLFNSQTFLSLPKGNFIHITAVVLHFFLLPTPGNYYFTFCQYGFAHCGRCMWRVMQYVASWTYNVFTVHPCYRFVSSLPVFLNQALGVCFFHCPERNSAFIILVLVWDWLLIYFFIKHLLATKWCWII